MHNVEHLDTQAEPVNPLQGNLTNPDPGYSSIDYDSLTLPPPVAGITGPLAPESGICNAYLPNDTILNRYAMTSSAKWSAGFILPTCSIIVPACFLTCLWLLLTERCCTGSCSSSSTSWAMASMWSLTMRLANTLRTRPSCLLLPFWHRTGSTCTR